MTCSTKGRGGILVEKPEGKRTLGCRFVDNIKIYFREKGRGGMD
jgi:hypothetical protein